MLKTFFRNPCNIYFSLFCLYLMQGTLYASGSIVSQVLLGVILLMSLKPFWTVLQSNDKSDYFKGLSALVVMYVVYGVFLMVTDGSVTQGIYKHPRTMSYIKGYMLSLLPIYACYDYAKKGYLNAQMLRWWVIVFVIVATAGYYREQQNRLIKLIMGEEVTNNFGYTFLSLIPVMLIFTRNPLLRYIGVGYCSVFVIMAMKRGAILILVLTLILFILKELRTSKGRTKFWVVVLVVLSVVFLVAFVQNMLESSDYFNHRIEQTVDGNSSGRDELYSTFVDAYFNNANISQILIGRGANGTLKVATNYAHNDWLETLTNQGALGFIIFFIYWMLFWKTSRNRCLSEKSRFALLLIFIIFGAKTMFSMSIGDMTIYVSSIFGYALADGFARDKELLN